jgi:hypothetical protein
MQHRTQCERSSNNSSCTVVEKTRIREYPWHLSGVSFGSSGTFSFGIVRHVRGSLNSKLTTVLRTYSTMPSMIDFSNLCAARYRPSLWTSSPSVESIFCNQHTFCTCVSLNPNPMFNTVFCFHAILPATLPFVFAVLLSAIDTRAKGGTEYLLIRTTGVTDIADRHAVSDRGCPKLRHMEQAPLGARIRRTDHEHSRHALL